MSAVVESSELVADSCIARSHVVQAQERVNRTKRRYG